MKKYIPVLAFGFTLFFSGCGVPKEKHSEVVQKLNKAEGEVSVKDKRISELEEQLNEGKKNLEQLQISARAAQAIAQSSIDDCKRENEKTSNELKHLIKVNKALLDADKARFEVIEALKIKTAKVYIELRKLDSSFEDGISPVELARLHREVKSSIEQIQDASVNSEILLGLTKDALSCYSSIVSQNAAMLKEIGNAFDECNDSLRGLPSNLSPVPYIKDRDKKVEGIKKYYSEIIQENIQAGSTKVALIKKFKILLEKAAPPSRVSELSQLEA